MHLENPSDFDELANLKRFFIFGDCSFSDKFQPMISARFPAKFYGFLTTTRTTERHAESAYRLRFWEDALPYIEPGDYVFLFERGVDIERRLIEKGARIGLPYNLWHIYVTYEAPTFLHFCKNHLKEKDIALNIGGNTGLTGSILASFCKHVHIFEANPEMEKGILATNVGHQNISVHMKAIYRNTGMATIYPVALYNTSMVAKDKSEPLEVPCLSVDDFCREMSVVPSVIKIDVEGVDGEVIMGSAETIRAHRPLIYLEHPLAYPDLYEVDLKCVQQALALLEESHELFAYLI